MNEPMISAAEALERLREGNRRFAAGKSDVYAACDIVRDARGPGRHHVIVLKSDGTIVDHAVPREGGCGC